MKKSKFEGVDFSSQTVSEINPDLDNLGQGFRCKRGEFSSYIKGDKIKNETRTHTSKCWVIECQEGLAAYITLLADKLTMGEPILIREDVQYKTFPAVKIGWLAADNRAKGSGGRLMDWAMAYVAVDLASRVGIRFLTVDALYDADENYDASGFYLKYGFRFVNQEDELFPKDGYRSMYFDLKPLIEALKDI